MSQLKNRVKKPLGNFGPFLKDFTKISFCTPTDNVFFIQRRTARHNQSCTSDLLVGRRFLKGVRRQKGAMNQCRTGATPPVSRDADLSISLFFPGKLTFPQSGLVPRFFPSFCCFQTNPGATVIQANPIPALSPPTRGRTGAPVVPPRRPNPDTRPPSDGRSSVRWSVGSV